MSKKVLLGILVLILAALLLYLWFHEPKKVLKKTLNTTGKPVATKSIQTKLKQQKVTETQLDELSNTIHAQTKQAEPYNLNGMSYLAVYRLYRKSILCETYFRKRPNSTDSVTDSGQALGFVDDFLDDEKTNWVKQGHEAIDFKVNEKQHSSLMVYADMCESVFMRWEATELSKQNNYLPQYALYDLLHDKKPKTDKEVQLKQLLVIEKNVKEGTQALAEDIEGEDTWTQEQITEAKKRIKALRKTQILGQDSNDEYAVRHNQDIWKQISAIELQISKQKETSPDQVQAQISRVENSLKQASEQLNTQDPEVYLLAKMVSEMRPNFSALYSIFNEGLKDVFLWGEQKEQYNSDYSYPSSVLMNEWGLSQKNKFLYLITIRATQLLYYCGLGAACGPESPQMLSMCLGLYGGVQRQACDVSVIDYYFNGQLTSGQIHDVEWMLGVMERLYAQ